MRYARGLSASLFVGFTLLACAHGDRSYTEEDAIENSGNQNPNDGVDAVGVDTAQPQLDSNTEVDAPAEEDAGDITTEDAADDSGSVLVDAGSDARADTGPTDAGSDARADAGPTDAGSDARADTGPTDAGSDARADAGPTDAGTDARADAGPVDAGPVDCSSAITCATASSGGQYLIVGDDPNAHIGLRGGYPTFFQLTISEMANTLTDLGARLKLSSPAGAQYELLLYPINSASCASPLVENGRTLRGTNVLTSRVDAQGSQTYAVVVEVRAVSGTCGRGEWTLNIDAEPHDQ